jgi:hypothetical protein
MRLLLFASLAAAALGCNGPDFGPVTIIGPPFSKTMGAKDGGLFRPVSDVLENRCGTLDCHGTSFRPLRIYGQLGLRLPVEQKDWNAAFGDYTMYYSGEGALMTTPDELLENYQSVIGLEPELTTKVVLKQNFPDVLSFIRKPRLAEKHKGGKIWDQAKPGDLCLTGWITAGPAFGDAGVPPAFNAVPCTDELKHK